MGASPQSFLALDLKGMSQENSSPCKFLNSSLRRKVLEAQTMRRQDRKQSIIKTMMKKRRSRRRPMKYGIKRRVRTLKKLVPNGRSKGLDALFKETADYIVCLQMKVKVMQMMVNLLSEADE